ncbi:beta-1,3-galactosyltransferase 5-like [Haliotis rubra]|uniref:beta-1,3-galactosyltransferase 5-like n=1 Tax=Haliotis rubra TaxID=36100 RepID=UPI001EE51D98|nr:beta-1,3-galactosyltransferase 5-like [Haliotis rubra]
MRRRQQCGFAVVVVVLVLGVVRYTQSPDIANAVSTKNRHLTGSNVLGSRKEKLQEHSKKPQIKTDGATVHSRTTVILNKYAHKDNVLSEEQLYFVKRQKRITPLDFNFTITGSPVCHSKNYPLLLVLVMTMHDHVEERKAIRETWGSVVKTKKWGEANVHEDTLIVFLLGKPDNNSKSDLAREENEVYHDIVEANFKESYYNLTYKVLMGYKWAKQFCPAAKYILKVDEDTFINMASLVKILGTLDLRNTVLGPYFETAGVERGGKHQLGKASYPFRAYPPHVKGNFYVMPSDLAFRVLEAAEYMPYVCIEDAHITGILLKVIGGKHIGVSPAAYLPKGPSNQICDFKKTIQTCIAKGDSKYGERNLEDYIRTEEVFMKIYASNFSAERCQVTNTLNLIPLPLHVFVLGGTGHSYPFCKKHNVYR